MKLNPSTAVACAIMSAAVIGLASAQSKPKVVMTIDFGRTSCGTWMEARTTRHNPNDVRFLQAREWTSGFLTAYNFYIQPDGNILARTDPEGAYAWIDGYCQQDPTRTVYEAVLALIDHLGGDGGRGIHHPPAH